MGDTLDLERRLRIECAKHRSGLTAAGRTLAEGLTETGECLECSSSPCSVAYPCELSAVLSEALSTIEALRKDAERLNHLDTLREAVVEDSGVVDPRDGSREQLLVGYSWTIGGEFNSVRSAIDSALSEPTP